MIFHPVAPRSEEWKQLRLGCIGSSEFHRIVTPAKMILSAQRFGLLHRLIAEWISGEELENYQSQWMERGTALEDQAIAAYENFTDAETSIGGWITLDDGLVGCSPDRLVGDKGDLEIKCPLLQTQVGHALEGLEEAHKCQIQGRLMITGREWVDTFSYHPLLFIPPLRNYRDEAFIGKLRPRVEEFREELLAARKTLENVYGPFVRPAPAATASDDEGALGVSERDVDDILQARRNFE